LTGDPAGAAITGATHLAHQIMTDLAPGQQKPKARKAVEKGEETAKKTVGFPATKLNPDTPDTEERAYLGDKDRFLPESGSRARWYNNPETGGYYNSNHQGSDAGDTTNSGRERRERVIHGTYIISRKKAPTKFKVPLLPIDYVRTYQTVYGIVLCSELREIKLDVETLRKTPKRVEKLRQY